MDDKSCTIRSTWLGRHQQPRRRSLRASVSCLFWTSALKRPWVLFLGLIVLGSLNMGCQTPQQWLRKGRQRVTPESVGVTNFRPLISDQFLIDDGSSDSTNQPKQADSPEEISPADKASLDQLADADNQLPAPDANSDTESLSDLDSAPSSDIKLTEADVVASVLNFFPQIQAVLLETNVAAGNLTAAMGAFDFNLGAQSISEPLGFYQMYRNSIGANQNIFNNGGNVYGGYRIGRGSFPTWYKDRDTNDGGEFALGAMIPLRQNRLIDARRAMVFRAQQDVGAADPLIREQQNAIIRLAKIVYWDWVGTGLELEIQSRLLKLAIERAEVIDFQQEQGAIPELTKVDNDRFIAERKTRLVEANRRFEASQISLSLFLRDATGNLLLAERPFLPKFEGVGEISLETLNQDIAQAINVHPEIARLDFNIEKARIDLAEAQNLVLGRLDSFAEASQDVGGRTSPEGDKTPFELKMGLIAELPVQRRLGLGRVMTAEARLRQIELERELLSNEIKTAVQDAYSAKDNAAQQFSAAEENVRLATRALEIASDAFQEGEIDLIFLNIYEQALATAEIEVLKAAFNYYVALANYELAMGRF